MKSAAAGTSFWLMRLLILAGPFLLLAGAFVYHVNLPGTRTGVYTFDANSVFISPIFPARRLEKILNGRQRVLGEPVYFTVRALRPYHTAHVQLHTRDFGMHAWKVGVQVLRGDEWSYTLSEPSPEGIVTLDLRGIPRTSNAYRFIISIHGLLQSDEVYLEEVRVTLLGDTGGTLFKKLLLRTGIL